MFDTIEDLADELHQQFTRRASTRSNSLSAYECAARIAALQSAKNTIDALIDLEIADLVADR